MKAKRKSDGEIFKYHKGYYDNDKLYWIYDEVTSVITEDEFNELYEVIPQTDLGVNDDTSKKDDILEDLNHQHGGMTTNWIEEIKDKGDVINAILEWSGIYDCGKCFDEDWNNHIVPIITTLLEKQREEYVEMIKGFKKNKGEWNINGYEDFSEHNEVIDDIIRLIKSHE